ncbi:transposase [Streptomyces sp. NPDC000931]|uniref:transposase n=1 Tax=Streptomyces sp. NPDC000931 TaxID=3154372 RepID=UPI0033189BBC
MRTRPPAVLAAAVPARVGHVEKWQPAPDMIDETLSWGIDIPLVVADAGCGDAAAFRLDLEERGLPCAVGISGRHTAHPAEAQPVQPACAGTGRPLKMQYPEPAQTMKDLVIAAGKAAARPLSWREGSRPGKGCSGVKRMYWRFATLRLRPAGRGVRKAADDPELPERWLLAERPAGESEPVQFRLSSLPSGMPLATVVRLAKLRWSSEHEYREMKQALGLAHFEGRTWAAGTTTAPSSPPPAPSAPCNDWPTTQKIQRRPEPLPGRPRTTDTPRHLDRRLPHLPPRHTRTHTNLAKPY